MKLLFFKCVICFIAVFQSNNLKCQDSIKIKNLALIDTLEKYYYASCTTIKKDKTEKRLKKTDIRLLRELNKIHKILVTDTSFSTYLKQLNFFISSEVLDEKGKKIVLYVKHGGNIRILIQQYYDFEVSGISRKIQIITNNKFTCRTKETFVYSLIDFVYLKKIIKVVNIPLQISRHWSALESIN